MVDILMNTNNQKKKKIVIIGGGASGIMAALSASDSNTACTLYEKNDQLGKKLLITGKGRCNLTNSGELSLFIDNIVRNPSFMYSSLNRFKNTDLISIIESLGVPTKIERGMRVFPASNRAEDIVHALKQKLNELNVETVLKTSVKKVLTTGCENNRKVTGVEFLDGSTTPANSVILATGGKSYPKTGSTGDGYKIAAELGHSVIPLVPSLVPLKTKDPWVKKVQGLTLKNVSGSLYDNENLIKSEFGEMMFTHFGLTGPIILTLSHWVGEHFRINNTPLKLIINLKPALDQDTLDKRLQRDFQKFHRKRIINSLGNILPSTLIPVIVELSEIPPYLPVNQVSAEQRRIIVNLLQNLELSVTGTLPIETSIVTAGGVRVSEINPNSMESKLVKGLYIVGELLDVNGLTGGFNLQIAFSTGWAAGNAAKA